MLPDREDQGLADRVNNAFAPYVSSKEKISSVRHIIALNVSECARYRQQPCTEAPSSLWPHTSSIRRKYLEALSSNASAKQEYDSNVKQNEERLGVKRHENSSPPDADSLLSGHLKLLRQRRYNHKLDILKHYADELEVLASKNKIFVTSTLEDRCESAAGIETNRTVQIAQEKNSQIRNLELAIINAKEQQARERTLKREVELQISTSGGITTNKRLRALLTTRQELTAWIEESLVRCGGIEIDPNCQIEENSSPTATLQQELNQVYEAYLEERRRLIDSVMNLDNTKTSTEQISERAKVVPNNATEKERPLSSDMLVNLLSVLRQQKQVSAQQSFLSNRLEEDTTKASETLHKLNDESQLLSSNPVMANSDRFKNAKSAFGKVSKGNDNVDNIIEHIQSWCFATSAAEQSSTQIVQRHLSRGQEALNGAKANLEDMRLLYTLIQQEQNQV